MDRTGLALQGNPYLEVAMSLGSLSVIANALRLRLARMSAIGTGSDAKLSGHETRRLCTNRFARHSNSCDRTVSDGTFEQTTTTRV